MKRLRKGLQGVINFKKGALSSISSSSTGQSSMNSDSESYKPHNDSLNRSDSKLGSASASFKYPSSALSSTHSANEPKSDQTSESPYQGSTLSFTLFANDPKPDPSHLQTQRSTISNLKSPTPQAELAQPFLTIPADDVPKPNEPEPNNEPESLTPEGIRAFRTTSSLLSILLAQGLGSLTQTQNKNSSLRGGSQRERQEVRLLAALATVLVRKHEVVAVVPLNRVSAQGQPLQVIAYAHSYNDNDALQWQESSQPNNKSEPSWEIWATGNRRLDDGPENGSLKLERWDVNPLQDEATATLVAAAKGGPSSFLTGGPNDYATFNSDDLPFDRNVAIVSMMLNYSHSQANEPMSVPAVFQDYITAACAWKMERRFDDPLSAPFMESFDGSDLSFEFRDNVYSHKDTKSDLYLCEILDHINGLPDFAGTVPALLARKEVVGLGRPFELYTAETCAEFHQLLCRLLLYFPEALNILQATREAVKQAVDSGRSSQSHRKSNKNRHPTQVALGTTPEDFTHALDAAVCFGRWLHALVQSRMLEAHLRVLEHSGKLRKPGKVGRGGGGDEEPDVDLQGVYVKTCQNDGGQEIKIPLWESYMNWLELLVAHFDAIDILHRHVIGKHFTGYSGVIIRVFPPPPVTRHLLGWRDLLRSACFPDSPKSGTGTSASVELSNENIITFLEKSMEKGALLQDAKHRLQKCGPDVTLFDGIVDSLKKDLKELLGGIDVQAFILETESDIEEISNLAKDAHLLVKQYTIDRMLDSESLSGAVFSAGLEESDEGRRLKVLLEKAMIKARDELLEFKMRTKGSPDMGQFVQIIASLNHELKDLAADTHNEEFIKHTHLGTHCISGAVKAARQSASSSIIVAMADELIPSYAVATFITNWEKIMQEHGFSGVEHCEALLSCLICCARDKSHVFNESAHNVLAMLKEAGVDLVGASHVIGVSKPCCPFCHHLLEKLSKLLSPDKFIVKGSHSGFSPCSLPQWVPARIVHEMNMEFGLQLRGLLIELLQSNSKARRIRTKSSTSSKLSSDSLESQEPMSSNIHILDQVNRLSAMRQPPALRMTKLLNRSPHNLDAK